eukprot:Gb_11521 [translate_table: standard]
MASSSIHSVLNALTKKLSRVENYNTWTGTMQHVFTLYKLWGYITGKIAKPDDIEPQSVKDTYQENLDNALAIIILAVIPTSELISRRAQLPRMLGILCQIWVGEIVADKEMVMATIINLPREGPSNLGPFITRTSKGDSSGAYAIKYQGKASTQKKSGEQGGQQ